VAELPANGNAWDTLSESQMDVVVVESPAKAKTINKYLGSGYKVLASYGHVRDLPPKDGSVRPDEGFAMDWSTAERGETRIRDIAKALKDADGLILATDPDREGEAISWHVLELLRQRGAIKGKSVHRVVFHEITKNAILEAMRHPRELDRPLIDAYLARRALDYLVGFTLSPVLWRKLPGSRSAGRVQSVALRLICEREGEIEVFVPREYWTVDVELAKSDGAQFIARLIELDGKKLDKFGLPDEAAAKAAVEKINRGAFAVRKIDRRQTRRHPYPPFTTSTLQQEASRKIGLSAQNIMRIAQRLYEGIDVDGETVGLITYMRTDSVTLSGEAIGSARRLIERDYGKNYVPDAPRTYKSSAKNAQEAHEAIRPTDMFRKPEALRALKEEERRLYDLIWKRTLASQMESAVLDQVSVDIGGNGSALRATGSVVAFDGFLKLYQESRDEEAEKTDPTAEDSERRLPPLVEGEGLTRRGVTPEQHFTQPPPRYSEASLVKKLEELGIGRPSTYASIISVLQERQYVRLEKRRFIPEDRGRIVTTFLENFFERYVQYNFTAKLEDLLDDISEGKIDWRQVLTDFWGDFSKAIDGTKDLTITQVIDALDEALGPHFFPDKGDGSNPRLCPGCGTGRLGLKLGKFGAFVGCSNYPDCRYTSRLTVDSGGPDAQTAAAGPVALGNDPAGLPVTLRKGPYGLYVQLGEAEGKEKPKRVGLPKGWSPSELDLDKAVKLLSLPREIGKHPETGEPIKAGIGRFGPYIQHERTYASIPADEDVLTIGINRAVDLIKTKADRTAQSKLRDIGRHPKDDKDIALYKGRFGPYLKHGRTVATLPKDVDADTLTLDAAVALVDARTAKGKPARGKGKSKPAAENVVEAKVARPKKKAPTAKAKKTKASNDDGASGAPKRRRAKAVGEA
jgi:DNA topoisomerase I